MLRLSIRDIEFLTGIKAPALRIWKQAFDVFKAPQNQGSKRLYSNEDLKKLLSISFLYHNGWKTSRIAALSDEEISEMVREIRIGKVNYKTFVQQLLLAAIDFNEALFLALLNRLTKVIGFEKMVVDVCYPYMQRVELLWDTNNAIAAQEHFSTYIIQNRIISETEKYSVTQSGAPEIVLFCPELEFYELPLLYLNYLLRKAGWKVLYLGSHIKITDLKQVVFLPGITCLYLHLITSFNGFTIDDYFETLRKTFPDKIIVASGKGIEQSQRNFVNFHLLKRDEDIYKFINSFPRSSCSNLATGR